MPTLTQSGPLMTLLLSIPDSERHPIIVESEDWETKILPAAAEWVNLLPIYPGVDATSHIRLLRILSEAIYTLGYRRGKKSSETDVLDSFTVHPRTVAGDESLEVG